MSELKMKIREIKGKQTTDDQPKTTLVGNGDLSEEVSNQPIKKEEGLTFVPSVIIKVTLAEPVSKKFLKVRLKFLRLKSLCGYNYFIVDRVVARMYDGI